MESTVERPYRSRLRPAQADATRLRIAHAAHDLMIERGYGGTTLADVARAAGVSVQTVYASSGGKPELAHIAYNLALAGDGQLVKTEETAEIVHLIIAEPDPRRKLRLYADNAARTLERVGPLIRVLRTASGGPGGTGLSGVIERAERQHLEASRSMAEHFGQQRHLADGVTPEIASYEIYTLSAYENYERLTVYCGWTADSYSAWLSDRLASAILRPA